MYENFQVKKMKPIFKVSKRLVNSKFSALKELDQSGSWNHEYQMMLAYHLSKKQKKFWQPEDPVVSQIFVPWDQIEQQQTQKSQSTRNHSKIKQSLMQKYKSQNAIQQKQQREYSINPRKFVGKKAVKFNFKSKQPYLPSLQIFVTSRDNCNPHLRSRQQRTMRSYTEPSQDIIQKLKVKSTRYKQRQSQTSKYSEQKINHSVEIQSAGIKNRQISNSKYVQTPQQRKKKDYQNNDLYDSYCNRQLDQKKQSKTKHRKLMDHSIPAQTTFLDLISDDQKIRHMKGDTGNKKTAQQQKLHNKSEERVQNKIRNLKTYTEEQKIDASLNSSKNKDENRRSFKKFQAQIDQKDSKVQQKNKNKNAQKVDQNPIVTHSQKNHQKTSKQQHSYEINAGTDSVESNKYTNSLDNRIKGVKMKSNKQKQIGGQNNNNDLSLPGLSKINKLSNQELNNKIERQSNQRQKSLARNTKVQEMNRKSQEQRLLKIKNAQKDPQIDAKGNIDTKSDTKDKQYTKQHAKERDLKYNTKSKDYIKSDEKERKSEGKQKREKSDIIEKPDLKIFAKEKPKTESKFNKKDNEPNQLSMKHQTNSQDINYQEAITKRDHSKDVAKLKSQEDVIRTIKPKEKKPKKVLQLNPLKLQTYYYRIKKGQIQQNLIKISQKQEIPTKNQIKTPSPNQYSQFIKNYQPKKQHMSIDKLARDQLFKIEFDDKYLFFGQKDQTTYNGFGILIKENYIFQGYWKEGNKIQGYETTDQGTYIGPFNKNRRQGHGSFAWNNGQYYQGQWKKGLKSGKGIWTSPNGDRYQGNWSKGQVSGQGVHVTHSGQKYQGSFKKFLKHGKGKQTFPDGDAYEGEFRQGQPNGHGIYRSKYGVTYQGNFKDGEKNGQGQIRIINGFYFKGNFQKELPNGYGCLTYPDKDIYKGEFKNGQRHGQGTLQQPSKGLTFKGQWKNDEFVKNTQ